MGQSHVFAQKRASGRTSTPSTTSVRTFGGCLSPVAIAAARRREGASSRRTVRPFRMTGSMELASQVDALSRFVFQSNSGDGRRLAARMG